MKSFKEFITEGVGTPYKISWVKNPPRSMKYKILNSWKVPKDVSPDDEYLAATADTPAGKLDIHFNMAIEYSEVVISFSIDDEFESIDSDKKLSISEVNNIIATVVKASKDFTGFKKNFKRFYIGVKPSHASFYEKIVKKNVPSGWTVKSIGKNSWMIMRPGVDLIDDR